MSPNYAFERSVMEMAPNSGKTADSLCGADPRAWCPAQREC